MKKSNNLRRRVAAGFALTTLAALLAGCSGSSAPAPAGATGLALAGKVTDGYVKNAVVTLDLNDDRICAANEPKTITDGNGNFSFTATENPGGGQHMTCASGGTDLSTGLPLVGQLLAPPGATQITPLTNVVMAQINSTLPAPVAGTASKADTAAVTAASAKIATNLGLGTTDLLTADPVATTGTNPALLQATAAVQVLMQQTTAAVAAATGAGADQGNQIFQNAANSVAAALTAAAASANPNAALGNIANAVVSNTVTKVAADPAIDATVRNKADLLAPASVAAFVAPEVAKLVASVATASVANLTTNAADNPATAAQSNVTVANATNAVATLLTDVVAGANSGAAATTLLNNLTTLSATVQTELKDTTQGGNTAAADINAAVVAATTGVTVAPASVPATQTAATVAANTSLQNVVLISSIAVNDIAVTNTNGDLSATAAGGITSATLNLAQAVPANYALPATADVAFSVVATAAGDQRLFTFAVKGLTLTAGTGNLAGTFTLAVPQGVTGSAYGINTAGTAVSATLANPAAALTSTASAGASTLKLNIGTLLTALGAANSGFNTLNTLKGTFSVTAVVGKIPLAVSTKVAAANGTIAIVGTNPAVSVAGSSRVVTVTVN